MYRYIYVNIYIHSSVYSKRSSLFLSHTNTRTQSESLIVRVHTKIYKYIPQHLHFSYPTQTQGHNQNHSSYLYIQKYMNTYTKISSLSASHTNTRPQSESFIMCVYTKIHEYGYRNVFLVRIPYKNKATIRIGHCVFTCKNI